MKEENRALPHNESAEQSVIGGLLFSAKSLSEVFEIIKDPSMFYFDSHQLIFGVIKNMFDESKNIDINTVWNALKQKKIHELVGGFEYLTQLMEMRLLAHHVVDHAQIVVDCYQLRNLINISNNISTQAYRSKDPKEVIEYAEQEIFDLTQKNSRSTLVPIKDTLASVYSQMAEIQKDPESAMGIRSGFKQLDMMTNGLKPSELVLLAARPSMGKTAFALNICLNAAVNQGKKVAIFSLEMSKESLTTRMIAAQSFIEMDKLIRSDLDTNDWASIMHASQKLSQTGLYIDDTGGITTSEIRSKAMRLKATQGLDLIMIDYIQLINGGGRSENRQQEVSLISRQLKQIARELRVPVLALSQLSRSVESRTDKRPMLSDLRESGAIEQDADICMFIYRDEYYNKENTPEELHGVAEIIIAKQRNGETGNVKLAWVGKYQKFNNITQSPNM